MLVVKNEQFAMNLIQIHPREIIKSHESVICVEFLVKTNSTLFLIK